MTEENNSVGEGLMILLIGSFFVLLIVKLMWYIDIPWLVVFSPIFVPIILIILIGLIMDFVHPPNRKY
jgi:hypothetical protein